MTVDHGMNLEEVNALADALQKASEQLLRHAATLDKMVQRSAWAGAVGAQFKQQWWPQHRGSLTRTADAMRDFGDSARRNLREQVSASSADGVVDTRSFTGAAEVLGARHGGDARDAIGESIFWLSRASDLHEFVEDFGTLRNAATLKGFFHHADEVKLGPIAVLGTGWDIYNLFDNVSKGDVDGSIRSGIDTAFDIGGLAVPNVGLAKGAWDLGWQVGKGVDWVFGEKLGGHQALIDSVIVEQYGGSLTVAEADNLAHRYDGGWGFGRYLGDSATSSARTATNMWKKVFG